MDSFPRQLHGRSCLPLQNLNGRVEVNSWDIRVLEELSKFWDGKMCIFFFKNQPLNISAMIKSFPTKEKKLEIWVILMDKCKEELVWIECVSVILKVLKKLFVMENVKIRIVKWTSITSFNCYQYFANLVAFTIS